MVHLAGIPHYSDEAALEKFRPRAALAVWVAGLGEVCCLSTKYEREYVHSVKQLRTIGFYSLVVGKIYGEEYLEITCDHWYENVYGELGYNKMKQTVNVTYCQSDNVQHGASTGPHLVTVF